MPKNRHLLTRTQLRTFERDHSHSKQRRRGFSDGEPPNATVSHQSFPCDVRYTSAELDRSLVGGSLSRPSAGVRVFAWTQTARVIHARQDFVLTP